MFNPSPPFHISPSTHSNTLFSSNLLRLGTLNVRSLVSPTKQFNLFSILLSRALHGIILTETNLCSPAHRYICNPYLNSYNYHSWFTHSPIANRHSGVGIILHSSLAMYVVRKKFFSDRLIGLTLQLPGKRNVLIIGGYVPPVSSSNRSIIADCYSTLISWIRSAHLSDHSVLLGGDLNADLEIFLKQLTAAHPGSSPLNPLFKFLHEQNFDDLCELDSSSLLPSPTFRSSSSGSLSRLDYIWISPFFPVPHLWSSVLDLTDIISTDHFLIIAHFDFLELKDHHAPSYMKQRQRCRTSYDFHSASPAQKESFASTISTTLPNASSFPRITPLNQLWHQFKLSLLSASRSCFPRVNISLTRPKDIPHELQPYTRLNNSLSHFLMALRRKANISQLQHAWSRFFVDFKPNFLRLFSDQVCLLNNLPDPLKLDEIFILSNLSFDEFRTQFKKSLRKLKKFLSAGLTLEFKKFKTTSMKSAIAERNENFYENKGKFISSSLNRERRCIVLDRVLVVDISDGPKLLVAPEEIKAAAITHFQNVVGPSVSSFDSLSALPPRWKKRYAPLEQFQESLYDPVMAHISIPELREVISLSPTHKAPGPSSIPYEWFRVLPDAALEFLCELMNRCLDSSDIPEDWRLASIAPIPKPHEFDALLKNTRPITLLETARKLLVKIVNNRLSNILATHRVLQGNNFAGLPGSSVNTPINVLDGIIKSHRLSRSSQELWILSQDISKAFDSIDLRMLRLAFNRLRFPDNLSDFIISLFTNRKNRIFTPYGPTSFYNVLIGIDQGEVISPLLWTIYFDPLLTELSESAISPYLWTSHIPTNILALNDNERHNLMVPITQLTYMDDSTLFSSFLDGLQQLLSIARDFYFLNNITANFSKYELVSSLLTSSPITFSLISEFPSLVDNADFQLTLLKLSSSFRFLGVWFNLQGSPSFVVSQIKDIYNSFVSTIRFKKLTSAQLAYLHSAVILPKVHFRSQVIYLPEATLLRIVRSYYGLHRKLLSVSRTFPSLALTSKLFTEDVNPYTYLCQRLISRLMAWISAYSSGSFYSDWIAVTFRALQVALKWPSSLDQILDFSRWNSSRRSIHHNWIFQALRILSESGLNIKLPVGLCLDLMPRQSVPLVTLSSELANSEKATWLFSPLWCLSQLIDPFRQFPFTWTDLKRLNLVPKTSKTPSWFTRLINIPDLISYLPVSSGVVAYPPYLLALQGSALDVIDEQSRIKARNRYYWIAGLDGSDSMIFGRVFYTVDVHGTRTVYFSHWSTSSSNRFTLSPCQGCSLYDGSIVDGPLQVRSVGSKLTHRSCLTFLPSYRCLQLFHMPTRIDSTCNNINLFLSPFLLCSFFKILLGYSCVRVPELFLVDPGIPSSVLTTVDVSLRLPIVPPTLFPEIHLCPHLYIYVYAEQYKPNTSSSDSMGCGWLQRDDDEFILATGSFLWTNGPVSPQASELGFILQVLCLLPDNCSIDLYSIHSFASLYKNFSGSSPERRVRFPCYLLWMAIHEQIVTSCLHCSFHTIAKVSADPYLSRCNVLIDSISPDDHSFPFNSLLDLPLLRRILVVSLCNGIPLVTDPVGYWRTFTNMRNFFDIMNLSRFAPLRSSYSSIDWNLTFDLLKDTLYHRLDTASISSSYRFRLQLWFDELPLMFRLRFRYPGLYADDSLCPNCGVFMETLEHFFTCSPDAPITNDAPPLISFRIRLLELLDRFFNRLARKASSCPKAQLELNAVLTQLKAIPSLGFSSLQNYSDALTFTGLWFLRGFIPRDLTSLITSSSGLPRRAASKIILRQFLKLHREIYHQLWRPRCKMKSLMDTALNITPAMLRTMKCSDFTNFRFDTSPVTPSLTNESLSPLQASEWSSLGIFWTHSAIIREDAEWELLDEINQLLHIFDRATKHVSHNHFPTIKNSVPVFNWLMDKIEDFQNSDIKDVIKTAAMKAMNKLKKYYQYTDTLVYSISTILDPWLKLTYYKDNNWEDEYILEDNIFTIYMKHTRGINGINLLEWWKLNETQYPHLAAMARDYLAIPATSVPIERAFSGGTDLVTQKKCSLSPETIRACMCLKSWWKN
ncbi:unnamed protein product [Rhizophagus irregularis]|nr:unnamed protein product [Rhizophagus irregularis]